MPQALRNSFGVVAALVVLGTLYQAGFWTLYRINSFEYITSLDVLMVATIPLTQNAFLMCLVLTVPLVMGRMSDFLTHAFSRFSAKKGNRNTAVKDWEPYSMLGIFILVFAWQAFDELDEGRLRHFWVLCPVVVILLLILFLYDSVKRKGMSDLAALYTFTAVSLCIVAFSTGRYQALKIHDQREYNYVLGQDLPAGFGLVNDRIKIVGKLGDNLFLSPLDNSEIIVAKESVVGTLRLRHQFPVTASQESGRPTGLFKR